MIRAYLELACECRRKEYVSFDGILSMRRESELKAAPSFSNGTPFWEKLSGSGYLESYDETSAKGFITIPVIFIEEYLEEDPEAWESVSFKEDIGFAKRHNLDYLTYFYI